MSVGLPSDEVAKDYKESLDDLTINSKYEIVNLTVIARENTEHAMAISRVLENHISKVSDSRALYLSLLYLGRYPINEYHDYTLLNANQISVPSPHLTAKCRLRPLVNFLHCTSLTQ